LEERYRGTKTSGIEQLLQFSPQSSKLIRMEGAFGSLQDRDGLP